MHILHEQCLSNLAHAPVVYLDAVQILFHYLQNHTLVRILCCNIAEGHWQSQVYLYIVLTVTQTD